MNEEISILVLGAGGQLGSELIRQSWPAGIAVYAPKRDQLDLMNDGAVDEVISLRRWHCVINAAAYTAVDNAEAQVTKAWRINALVPAMLAYATAKAGVPIVHVSTDYVFDGLSERPYQPYDAVRPLNVYGASKEGGEQAVRTSNPRHVIVRTAWLVSPHRANFVKTMLRLAKEGDALRVVDDQIGCPTSAADLADALRTISLQQVMRRDAPRGTYHFVNAGSTSWFNFAEEIMVGACRRGNHAIALSAIKTVDYPAAARRPAYSVLATETLTQDYGIQPRSWREALDDVLGKLLPPKRI